MSRKMIQDDEIHEAVSIVRNMKELKKQLRWKISKYETAPPEKKLDRWMELDAWLEKHPYMRGNAKRIMGTDK